MAQSCLRFRNLHSAGLRPGRRLVTAVRAESGNVSVTFRIQRHVEYGQQLMLVGNSSELGAWDAKNALTLAWNAGDNWTTDAVVFPIGAAVEYKYIVKRRDGLEWCPGQNKSVTLPAAGAVEVSDSWDPRPSAVSVVAPLPVATETPPTATTMTPAAAVVASAPAAAAAPAAPEMAYTQAPAAPEMTVAVATAAAETNGAPIGSVSDSPSAVVTVENVELEEGLDGLLPPVSAAADPAAGPSTSHQPPPAAAAAIGLHTANNIVQAAPLGAIALGGGASPDPITEYEEADKYQVMEVGAGGRVTAAAPEAPAAVKRSMDSMTVSELKTELKRRGLSSFGTRRELIIRLQKVGAL